MSIVTLGKAGRVFIPKALRDELRLAAGDSLTLESDGDQVMLRPVRSASPLHKKHGIWVFRGSRNLTAAETDRELESARILESTGANRVRPFWGALSTMRSSRTAH